MTAFGKILSPYWRHATAAVCFGLTAGALPSAAQDVRIAEAETHLRFDLPEGPVTLKFPVFVDAPGTLRLSSHDPRGLAVDLRLSGDPTPSGWVRVAAGDRGDLVVTWAEGGERPARVSFAFSPDPEGQGGFEPNDTPATARRVDLGRVETRLFPETDLDVFALEAPGDGVFIATLLDAGGHEGPVFRWLDATGAPLRDGYEADLRVSAGETVYLELRSDDFDPYRLALETPVVFSVAFWPEPYPEPNDTPGTATPLAPDTDVALRLAPRLDRDVFAVTAPGDGVFIASLPETGGHEEPVVRWLAADGTELRPNFENSLRVAAGETYFVEVRASDYPPFETAREDDLTLRVAYWPEPHDEPNDTPATATPLGPDTAVALRLAPRLDRDVFSVTAPGDGVFIASLPETGGHEEPVVRWLAADGTELRPNFENSLRVAAGETYFVEVRASDYPPFETARPDDLTLVVAFWPEPYAEPNDTPATATPLDPDTEGAFRLAPRLDRDVFAVTAPGDGVFAASLTDTGGHEEPVVRWLAADGTELRPNYESTLGVVAGETYFVEVRASDYPPFERARAEDMALHVAFWPALDVEPNDVPATALAAEVGEVVRLRLAPRLDRDVVRIDPPADGVLEVEVLETGGHGGLHPVWIDADATPLAVATWSQPAEAGVPRFLEVRSSDFAPFEEARQEAVVLRVRLRLPDGSYLGDTRLPDEVALAPWQVLRVPAGEAIPLILVAPPDPGLYALSGLGPGAVVRWRDVAEDRVLDGAEQALAPGRLYALDVLDPGNVDTGARVLRLDLRPLPDHAGPGLYPRLPSVEGAALFDAGPP